MADHRLEIVTLFLLSAQLLQATIRLTAVRKIKSTYLSDQAEAVSVSYLPSQILCAKIFAQLCHCPRMCQQTQHMYKKTFHLSF